MVSVTGSGESVIRGEALVADTGTACCK